MDLSPDERAGGPRRRIDLFVVGVLLAAAGLLGTLSSDRRTAVTAELRSTVLAPFLGAHEVAARQVRLARRLEGVRRERDSLARKLTEARARSVGRRDLDAVLDVEQADRDEVLAVRLGAARRRVGTPREFAVRAGRRQGVEPPAGVFTAEGLLGVVRWAGEGTAGGEYWTHPDFRVSVRTGTGDASGIVRPSQEGGQPVMLLEGAPYQRDIPEGTVVYTSGLGGVYPPGIPVGTVRSLSGVESGWEKSYRVEAAVRPEQTDAGLVWVGASPSP